MSFGITFKDHLINTTHRTIREILPWYFGVYKWLSLTLPPIVYQLINRILIISILGLAIWVFKMVKGKSFDQQAKVLAFFAYTAIAYFLSITIFDWYFIRGHGFPFGIQGRYFFPTIIAHISLVFVGLLTIAPKSLKKWLVATLVAGILIFNYFSLYWVALHYYDFGSLNTFITQANQYKPEIFKGMGVMLIIVAALLSTTSFLLEYFKLFFKTKSTIN